MMRLIDRAILLLAVPVLLAGCAPGPSRAALTPVSTKTPAGASQSATVPSGSSDVKLVDTTRDAGLDFIQTDCGCGMRYFVEQIASGAAVLDANGDGNLDIYFPQPKPL